MQHFIAFCHLAVAFLQRNELAVGLFITAGILTMPAADCPVSWRTLYKWFFDWLHQFLNLRRPTPPAQPPAQPPEGAVK